MPITITNNNSVVGVSQEVNTIQVGMASAFDASATALQAAADADAAKTETEILRDEVAERTAALGTASVTTATWADLSTLTPDFLGQGAETLDSDTGTHTDPSTSDTVDNAGRYTAYALTEGAWTWIGGTGLSSKLSTSVVGPSATSDIIRTETPTGRSALRLTRTKQLIVAGVNWSKNMARALLTADAVYPDAASRAALLTVQDASGRAPIYVTRNGRVRLMGRDVVRDLDTLANGAALAPELDAINAKLTPGKNIVAVGDSLTAYAGSWAQTLIGSGDLTDSSRALTIAAVGGHTSAQTARRLGALPFLCIFSGGVISASGGTPVTTYALRPDGLTLDICNPVTNQGPTWRGSVDGIAGTFSATAFDGGGQPTDMVFTPDDLATDAPVNDYTPTTSLTGTGHERDLIVMCLGENNFTDPETVKNDWLAIRDWQVTLEKRMVVITPPGTPSSGISNPAAYADIVDLENFAQHTWGDKCIVSRQLLMRYGDGSEADNAAIADGRVPPSLTTDGIHWTTTPGGGHEIIRGAVADIINSEDW